MMRRTACVFALLAFATVLASCTPEKAMDFGPTQEVTTPPEDQLSRDILRDFDGHDFTLGKNDAEAEVSLSSWAPGRHLLLPFWLGINPLFPYFKRPNLGHIYVISEAIMVRPLTDNQYLIRAGSKMFKADAVFAATHTRYPTPGMMLPTVVRFIGTRVITVPRDAPDTGTVTEKVAVLREVSLPMHLGKLPPGYAAFQTSIAS